MLCWLPTEANVDGHPPLPLERMLRVYFMQQWFNFSVPQAEDALYVIKPTRRFAGVVGLLKERHLLLKSGTIVEANL